MLIGSQSMRYYTENTGGLSNLCSIAVNVSSVVAEVKAQHDPQPAWF
jgi:hypothetical protein